MKLLPVGLAGARKNKVTIFFLLILFGLMGFVSMAKQPPSIEESAAEAEQMLPEEERLVFRTGPWRSDVRPLIIDREPGDTGLYLEDLPGSDYKVPLSIYLIDDVKTRGK